MTITEASEAKVSKLKRYDWNQDTYAVLDLFPDGTHGPWVTIVSPTIETKVLVFELPQDGWELVS